MSTHFFGLKDWTFTYSHSIGRNEFAGTGFRNPVSMALAADDVVYVLNRSYENRLDGLRVTVCTLGEEYISEFGSYGEGDGQFVWPTAIAVDAAGLPGRRALDRDRGSRAETNPVRRSDSSRVLAARRSVLEPRLRGCLD